jgi:hypothetical protein
MLSEVSIPYGDITLTEAEQLMMEGDGNDASLGTGELKSGSSREFPAETVYEAGPDSHRLARCRSLDALAGRDLYFADNPRHMHGRVEGQEVDMGKRRLQRISSAGTTVITPSDDSVEAGGSLPGALYRTLDEGDRKGKRKARSFL